MNPDKDRDQERAPERDDDDHPYNQYTGGRISNGWVPMLGGGRKRHMGGH